MLGSAAILLIGSNSLLMTRSQSGSRFPEDTTLAAADPSLEDVTSVLTASFNATEEFCQSHGLIINPAETQLIILKE